MEEIFKNALLSADIVIGGTAPGDMIVHDPRLYRKIALQGTLGLGEGYMDGWWDAEPLDVFFRKAISADVRGQTSRLSTAIHSSLMRIAAASRNCGHVTRSHAVGKHHYDIGNDLYERMLDGRMTYTCAYFGDGATTLEKAQDAKLDLVCRKLGLRAGMSVLDIGCGWGSFLRFAAEEYGVSGVGVTISREQAESARKRCDGLPIDIRLTDYRDVSGSFDRIVSLGMFEHVGPPYYGTYARKVRSLLSSDGLFLLHTIGSHISDIATDPWIDRYIFPGGVIPSLAQIARAIQPSFIVEDWHNFGHDYSRTLRCWFENFHDAWQDLKRTGKYDDRFYRMWKYYLCSCAGAFDARVLQLWQIVLSPRGVPGGYVSVR